MKRSSIVPCRLAFALFVAGRVFAPLAAECEPAPPTCKVGPDSYVVGRSTLDYSGVSDSYARSVYSDVQQTVSGYLSESPDGRCFFIDGLLRLDSPGHDSNKDLNVDCAVRRVSNMVLLSVRIVRSTTQDVLLSFETSAPFCRPASATAAFAEEFPDLFSEQVIRQFRGATPPPKGFWVNNGGGLCLEYVNYTIPDLKEDLQRTEGLPPSVTMSVTESLRQMSLRRTVDGTAMVVLWGGGFGIVGIGLIGMIQPDYRVPTEGWLVAGGAILLGVLAYIDAIHAPRPVAAALNNWQAGQ